MNCPSDNCPSSSDEGLTLETSASESLYGGQFTLSTQLIKPNYLVILPPTQHHSFFRNLPPLFVYFFELNKVGNEADRKTYYSKVLNNFSRFSVGCCNHDSRKLPNINHLYQICREFGNSICCQTWRHFE